MAENTTGFEQTLESLALITDGVQSLFPSGKSVLIYELKQRDFNYVRGNFKNIKYGETQIKIDISGTEVVFILEDSYKEESNIEKIPINKKQTFRQKIKNIFSFRKSGKSSV
jgi:hypothetical protein